MISAIVAVDTNWGIGFNGELLEQIPEDLKRFKQLTTGNTVVMGRKTWDSLPIKPLPNRSNLIITKNPIGCPIELDYQFTDLPAAIEIILSDVKTDVFIIGGGQIYKQLLPYCDKVYVTKIYKKHENIDTYFPNLDKIPEWTMKEQSPIYLSNGIPYSFIDYART